MKNLFSGILLSISPILACGQDINTLARDIAAGNPSVEAARAGYEARISEDKAANTLSGPELDFDYKFGAGGAENRWGFSVGQAFDWPGVYASRRQATAYRAEAFRQLYRASFLDNALAAKQAIISLSVAREQLELLYEADAATEQLLEVCEHAYDQAEVTVIDISKVRLSRFEIANRVAEAEGQVEELKSTLSALGADADRLVLPSVTANLTLKPLDYYQQQLQENDPTVAASARLFKAAESDRRTARRAALPSFKLAYVHDFEEGMHFNGFSVGISLPAWSRKQSVKAAEAAARVEQLTADDYSLRCNAALIGDYRESVALNRRIDKGRSVFTSDEYPKALRKALDAGRITISDYLTDYRQYYESKASYIDLCGRLALLEARLSRYDLLAD